MSEKKQRDPDIDWGFHATMPRVIRTGYKNLTAVQKWLYVCFKDLCGEHGTCYRTVDVLSEETGISTGMISESIPVLHAAGIIHAEKKKRSSGGKPVWHITIVDIWQVNAKAHPTKRSHSEQTSQNVHTVNNNVHTVNNNVHTVNEVSEERSHAEQERSHSETEEVSISSIITEAVSTEEDLSADADNARALFFHPVYSFLALDSFEHPTTMTIFFEDDEQAEITNKGYGHIAEEIANQMTTMGTPLKVVTAKRQYAKTIDADCARDFSSQQKNISETPTVSHKTVKSDHVTGISNMIPPPTENEYHSQLSTKDVDKPSKPVEPPTEMKWGTRKCLQWFDFWRGGTLIGKYKNMQASTCAKGLAEQFTEDQVIRVRNLMMDDPFWIAQGVCDVCHVANNIHKYLNLSQQTKPNGTKPRPSVLVSEEQSKKNKARMYEIVAAKQAAAQAKKVIG